MDELFGCFISRCNEQKSSTFCSADYYQSHTIVSSGVNSVRGANICRHGRSDMAAISDRRHLFVTRCRPMASVAFSGKFWSMQDDRTGRPLGLRFGNGESQKLKRQEAKKKREETT
jgi:hypothetical protein